MAAPAEAVCSFPLLILGFEPIYLYCTVCFVGCIHTNVHDASIAVHNVQGPAGGRRRNSITEVEVVCTVQRGGAHSGGRGRCCDGPTARDENRDRCQLFWQSQRLVFSDERLRSPRHPRTRATVCVTLRKRCAQRPRHLPPPTKRRWRG